MVEKLIYLVGKMAFEDNEPGNIADIVDESAVKEAEFKLGFMLPDIISQCYQVIGNGGFGPGYGLIGLHGGADSDYGDIVETYLQLRSDQETVEKIWPSSMLPFVDFGSNIFACVDCENEEHYVSIFEDFELWEQEYTLEEFFEMWLDGIDILDHDTE